MMKLLFLAEKLRLSGSNFRVHGLMLVSKLVLDVFSNQIFFFFEKLGGGWISPSPLLPIERTWSYEITFLKCFIKD